MTWQAGQQVWLCNVNRKGGAQRVEIAKVGRVFFHVKQGHRMLRFRISDGRSADDNNTSIKTDEQKAEMDRRDALYARLSRGGVRLDQYDPPTRLLKILSDALDQYDLEQTGAEGTP